MIAQAEPALAPAGHGHADLLRTLYEQDRRVLFSYVLRLTKGDTQQAEDIVQETMLRAWRNAAKLDQRRASVRPWLATVARNVFIDAHRRASSRPLETEADPIEAIGVADESDNLLTSITVTEAMKALSQSHREVLVELYFRGRSLQDTADLLEVPIGTVKSRVYYALRARRGLLEQRGITHRL
jgi:RNA polymerase sigma-70 factor (ECF subfamily)